MVSEGSRTVAAKLCKSIPADRRQWFQLTFIIVIQGLRGFA